MFQDPWPWWDPQHGDRACEADCHPVTAARVTTGTERSGADRGELERAMPINTGPPGADDCPFCVRIYESSDLPRNEHAVSILDAFPRAPGHVLIVPVRHIGDYFALQPQVQAAIFELAPAVRVWQQQRYKPTGWALRINVGVPAGQSVKHVHMHVLPSYGDHPHDSFKHQETL